MKRVLSIFLAVAMVIGMLPGAIFAMGNNKAQFAAVEANNPQFTSIYFMQNGEKMNLAVTTDQATVQMWGSDTTATRHTVTVPEGTDYVYVEYPAAVSLKSDGYSILMQDGYANMGNYIPPQGNLIKLPVSQIAGASNCLAVLNNSYSIVESFTVVYGTYVNPDAPSAPSFDPDSFYADCPFNSVYFMQDGAKKYLTLGKGSPVMVMGTTEVTPYTVTVPEGTGEILVEYPAGTNPNTGYSFFFENGQPSYSVQPTLSGSTGEKGTQIVTVSLSGITGANKALVLVNMQTYAPLGGFTITYGDYVDPAAGSGGETEKIPVEAVTLDKEAISIGKGSKLQLNATITPADATDKTVAWASVDETVATVDQDGNVRGVWAGTTTVTATTRDGGKVASCTVNVIDRNKPPQDEDGVYLLGDQTDLEWFAEAVVLGHTDFSARLIDDIDLAYTDVVIGGSGSTAKTFTGTFDGNFHTISNLTLDESANGTNAGYLGLFGKIKGATIQNLTIENEDVDPEFGVCFQGKGGTTAYVGVLAGYDGGNSVITNVTTNVPVTVSGRGTLRYTAGILGYTGSNTRIENCTNNGSVTGTSASGITDYIHSNVTLKNCTNNGNITGTSSASGIAGTSYASASQISGCVNNGAVSANTDAAGILLSANGQNSTNRIQIQNCTNNGAISGNGNVGGISAKTDKAVLDGCVNTGALRTSKPSASIGGIVGELGVHSQVGRSINRGDVTATAPNAYSYTGGLLGKASYNTVICNNYVTGSVTAAQGYVGGITGAFNSNKTTTTMENCYFAGTLTGTSDKIGGLIGQDTSGNSNSNVCALVNCYYVGDMNAIGVSANPHTHQETNVSAKTPEELKAGVELGDEFVRVCHGGLPALKIEPGISIHLAGENGVVTLPTCTEQGYTTYTCPNCNESFRDCFVAALDHTFCTHNTEAECNECENCVFTDATCTMPGVIMRTCLREGCTEQKTDTIPAKGHSVSETIVDETNLYTVTQCTVCGEHFKNWKDERYQIITLSPSAALSVEDEVQYAWSYDASQNIVCSNNVGVDSSTSSFKLNLNLQKPADMKLTYVQSTEATDRFYVYLDDVALLKTLGGTTEAEKTLLADIPAGAHTLTFSYVKDNSHQAGKDLVWIKSLSVLDEHEHVQYTDAVYTWIGNNKLKASCSCTDCGKTWEETVNVVAQSSLGTCQEPFTTVFTSEEFTYPFFTQQTKTVTGSMGVHCTPIDGTVCEICGEETTDTIQSSLVDGLTTKSNSVTIDVLARNAAGEKIPATLFVGTRSCAATWDDSKKTTFSPKMDNVTEDLVVTIIAGNNSHRYMIHHQQAQEGEVIGYVTASLEAFTLGGGYLITPRSVPIKYGQNGAYLLADFLAENGFTYTNTGSLESGFYLAKIKDSTANVLPVELNVPAVLLEAIANGGAVDAAGNPKLPEEITAPSVPNTLGEFDYTSMSGWMYSVNNVFPNVGFSDYYPQNGDVMRVQFTLWGYGADLGGGYSTGGDGATTDFYGTADKGELTKLIAQKGWDNLLETTKAIVQKLNATQAEVDACIAAENKPAEVYALGDVNGDGEITYADAQEIALYLKDAKGLDGAALAAADVNRDGEITYADAQMIAALLKGSIAEFPKAN